MSGDGDMDEHWEYVSLSKRFESFAERATDPKLAAAYRSLAKQYRILDEWRHTVGKRYEPAESSPNAAASTAPVTHPPHRRKPS